MAHKQGFFIRYWDEVDSGESVPYYQPKANSLWGKSYSTAVESKKDLLFEKNAGFLLYNRPVRGSQT